MKFGKQIRSGTFERLKLALGQDPTLVVESKDLDKATGYTEEYFETLGLKHTDLKRLESCGFALRGWRAQANQYGKRGGSRTVWILIADNMEGLDGRRGQEGSAATAAEDYSAGSVGSTDQGSETNHGAAAADVSGPDESASVSSESRG